MAKPYAHAHLAAAEHINCALQLLAEVHAAHARNGDVQTYQEMLAEAQVHATLATAYADGGDD